MLPLLWQARIRKVPAKVKMKTMFLLVHATVAAASLTVDTEFGKVEKAPHAYTTILIHKSKCTCNNLDQLTLACKPACKVQSM